MKSKKVVITITSLCMLTAASLMGYFGSVNSKKEDYVDLSKAEEVKIETNKPKAVDQAKAPKEEKVNQDEKKETAGGNVTAENYDLAPELIGEDVEQMELVPIPEPAETTKKTVRIEDFHFSEEDYLDWPVNGKVLMNYNMDQTVYFKTLDQYKYNPAVLIAGEVNDPVMASARGKVVDILENEETGNTIQVDIGDGYLLTYGQLKEIPLKVGSIVEKGDIIGYIGETTKYYSEEGSNLYFSMRHNNTTKNPLDYMDTEGEE